MAASTTPEPAQGERDGRAPGGDAAPASPIPGSILPPERRRLRWKPLAAGAAGLVVSLVLAQLIVHEQRERMAESARLIADGWASKVAARVESQTFSLQSLAAFWARFGPQPAPEWRFDSEILIEHHPGLRWIAWVDPRAQTVRRAVSDRLAVPGDEPGDAELLALVRSEGALAGPRISGAVALPGGATAFRELVAVGSGDRARGVLVAETDVGGMLGAGLEATAPEWALSVRWGDRAIFGRGAPAPDAPAAWSPARDVHLAAGPTWTAQVAPTAALAARRLSPLPYSVLAAGVAASLLLSAALWQREVAREKSLALEGATRSLLAAFEERRRAELEVRRLAEELEARVEARTAELNEAITDLEVLNCSVSHDLKSPLGAVMNFATVLEEDFREVLGDEGRDHVERIRASAGRALAMMEALLAFSRLGREEIKKTHVDMERKAREVFGELTADRASPRASLEIGALPPVEADPSMMHIVLANLLSNAIKFSRKRPDPRVEVGAETALGEAIFFVRDNGVGFDMRHARKLFGVFERLHSKEEFEGHGVGLAVVARILRRHGGRVWAEAEAGRGATFYFALPVS